MLRAMVLEDADIPIRNYEGDFGFLSYVFDHING